MEFPFEGIPTIPPRKDMDRMVTSASLLGKPTLLHVIARGLPQTLRNLET